MINLYLRREANRRWNQAQEEASAAAKAAIQNAIQSGRPIDLDAANVVSYFRIGLFEHVFVMAVTVLAGGIA